MLPMLDWLVPHGTSAMTNSTNCDSDGDRLPLRLRVPLRDHASRRDRVRRGVNTGGLSGSHDMQELGCWDPSASIELTTSKDRFPLWYSSPICIGRLPAEFKFVIRRTTGEVKWENCDNRVLRRSRQCGNVLIRCRFGFRDISLSTESVFATETELSEDVSVDNHDEPHVPVRWGHVDGQMVG